MSSFGLGLVLNFTDNATQGMKQATTVFQTMSATADMLASSSSMGFLATQQLGNSMTILGNNMMDAGNTMLNVFSNIASKVVSTGSDFESFRITLNAMYGDATRTEEQLQKLVNFAAKSPFEIADVKDLLVTLQSQGIDAFNQMTGATSGLRQETLAWIGDLMAFKPEIQAERWKLALQNYIGSGESKILRNILDMGKIEDIIGHDVSDTVEGRMNDIVEIVESANLQGLMSSMFGTWQQTLSNFQDQITKIFLSIADSGAYNTLKSALTSLTSVLSDMTDSELESFAQVIADAFNLIAKPLEIIAKGLSLVLKGFIQLTTKYPEIAKIITVFAGIAGASLILGGSILSLSGQFLFLVSTIKYLGGLGAIFNVLKAGLTGVFSYILPIITAAGLLYFAWKSNIFGIRDIVTTAFGQIKDIITLTFDALADNTLSEEQFLKARDLGLLPFLEALLDLKYNMGLFIDGFKKGLDEGINKVTELTGIFGDFKVDLYAVADKIGDIISAFTGVEVGDSWEKAGEAFGKIAVGLTAFVLVAKVIGTIFSFIMKIVSIVKVVISVISNIGKVFSAVQGVIMPIITAIASALSLPVAAVVAIIAAIIAVVGVIIYYREQIWNFMKSLGETISSFIGELINKVSQLWNNLIQSITSSPLFQTISSIVQTIFNFVSQIIQKILSFASNIAKGIYDIFIAFVGVISSVLDVIVAIIKSVIDIISSMFSYLFEVGRFVFYSILYVVQAVASFIQSIWQAVSDFIVNLWNTLVQLVTPIIESLMPVVDSVCQFFQDTFDAVLQKVTNVFNGIKSAAESALNWISDKLGSIASLISSVAESFSGVMSSAGDIVHNAGTAVKKAVGLNTGGYVKGEGLTYLHPNEVVVNGPMTRNLGLFLDDYVGNKDTSKTNAVLPIQSNNNSDGGSDIEGIRVEIPDDNNYPVRGNPTPTNNDNGGNNYDYSVTFSAGSIVIHASSTSDSELQAMAEKLMKIIERKQQLKAMAVRR